MNNNLVNQDPFRNGWDEMAFEMRNCEQCINGSMLVDGGEHYTNADDDNMPKCSIQRDIVIRMVCDEPIKQETLDICNNFITHGILCPYRKPIASTET